MIATDAAAWTVWVEHMVELNSAIGRSACRMDRQVSFWNEQEAAMYVLLIEDDALLRMTLPDALIISGIEVNGLANAEDALILLGVGQVLDVLVTDVSLGNGLNGFYLADVARTRHPEISVILISGTVVESDQRKLRPYKHFCKNHSPLLLTKAIRQAARKR